MDHSWVGISFSNEDSFGIVMSNSPRSPRLYQIKFLNYLSIMRIFETLLKCVKGWDGLRGFPSSNMKWSSSSMRIR